MEIAKKNEKPSDFINKCSRRKKQTTISEQIKETAAGNVKKAQAYAVLGSLWQTSSLGLGVVLASRTNR